MDNILITYVVFTDHTRAIALVCDGFGRLDDDQQLSAWLMWYQLERMSVGFRGCLGRDILGLGYGRADFEDDAGRSGKLQQ